LRGAGGLAQRGPLLVPSALRGRPLWPAQAGGHAQRGQRAVTRPHRVPRQDGRFGSLLPGHAGGAEWVPVGQDPRHSAGPAAPLLRLRGRRDPRPKRAPAPSAIEAVGCAGGRWPRVGDPLEDDVGWVGVAGGRLRARPRPQAPAAMGGGPWYRRAPRGCCACPGAPGPSSGRAWSPSPRRGGTGRSRTAGPCCPSWISSRRSTRLRAQHPEQGGRQAPFCRAPAADPSTQRGCSQSPPDVGLGPPPRAHRRTRSSPRP